MKKKNKEEQQIIPPPAEEEKQAKVPKIKKAYTPRFYMMVLSGCISVVGSGCFILYFFTLNMVMGAPGIIMAVTGIFVFRYYWQKEGNISVEHIDGVKKDNSANSMNLYPDKVEFANVHEPDGFPMQCVNDKKRYYVNIWDIINKRLVPFVLPDQQWLDPITLAQRVLELPAHKKIFERKPKLIQQLKTVLLVAAIGIVWLLILTTTGG